MKLNMPRCLQGMDQIEVRGLPDSENRKALIEEAIATIQRDPMGAFAKEYIGYKNYAHFGDQRHDCEYGMGPRHGTIVFSIGRNRSRGYDGELDADAIYFLECVRDFGVWESPERNDYNRRIQMNLSSVLAKYRKLTEELETYGNALDEASVELEAVADGGSADCGAGFIQRGRGSKRVRE